MKPASSGVIGIPPPGRHRFIPVSGDRDTYLFLDLLDSHAHHGTWIRTGPRSGSSVPPIRCEHGVAVTRCPGCGTVLAIRDAVECEHLLDALNAIEPGASAVLWSKGDGYGKRVEVMEK
jgi:hypothetical protein